MKGRLALAGIVVLLAACGRRSGAGGDDDDDDDDQSRGSQAEDIRAAVVLGSCLKEENISINLMLLSFRSILGAPTAYDDIGELDSDTVHCLATAGGGCGALEECLGITATLDADCETGGTCAGTVSNRCALGARFEVDCGQFGAICESGNGCEMPLTGEPCDRAVFEDSCDAGQPTYCSRDDVVVVGPECASLGLGLECAPIEYGGVACRGAERSCDLYSDDQALGPPYEGSACVGDQLELCVNNGLSHLDCSTLADGFGCFDYRDQYFSYSYCGYGDFCDPEDTNVDCDGGTVIFCNMGRLERFDCTELGFTGCHEHSGCVPSPFG